MVSAKHIINEPVWREFQKSARGILIACLALMLLSMGAFIISGGVYLGAKVCTYLSSKLPTLVLHR